MSRYIYSVIRFVPQPVTGEYVNVGAIAGSDELLDWDVRLVRSYRRANKLDVGDVFSPALDQINRLAREIEAVGETAEEAPEAQIVVSEEWLHSIWRRSQNVIQLSEPMPIIAESAALAIETVFAQFVMDPVSEPRGKTKHAALSALRKAYKSRLQHGGPEVFERARVFGGNYPIDFDFAVANGKPFQLTQAFSFQGQDSHALANQVRSWAWGVDALRHHGGNMALENRTMLVPNDIDIEVVYVPPATAQGHDSFGEASRIFTDLGVNPVPLDRVGDVVNRVPVPSRIASL